jgi:hypothetical protein
MRHSFQTSIRYRSPPGLQSSIGTPRWISPRTGLLRRHVFLTFARQVPILSVWSTHTEGAVRREGQELFTAGAASEKAEAPLEFPEISIVEVKSSRDTIWPANRSWIGGGLSSNHGVSLR